MIDGLLRGDLKSRMDAYAVARQWGLINPNFVAQIENWEPIPDEDGGNDYWRPVNMAVVGAPMPAGALPGAPIGTEPEPTNEPAGRFRARRSAAARRAPDDEGEDAPAKEESGIRAAPAALFATEAAGRVVRKEVAALRKILSREPRIVRRAGRSFLFRPRRRSSPQTMCISPDRCGRYLAEKFEAAAQRCRIAGEKACVLDWIEDTPPEALAALALGKDPCDCLKEQTDEIRASVRGNLPEALGDSAGKIRDDLRRSPSCERPAENSPSKEIKRAPGAAPESRGAVRIPAKLSAPWR